MTISHMAAADWGWQKQNDVTMKKAIVMSVSVYDITQAELMIINNWGIIE